MSEGGTYFVECKRKGRRYDVCLSGQPDIKASGATLEEALDNLYVNVMEWNGDGEAVFEVMPGAWEGRGQGSSCFGLGWNESVRVKTPLQDIFREGVCARCRRGLGGRSSEPLELELKPRFDVFRIERQWPDDVYPARLVLSEKFLEVLTDPEREMLELRPVISPPSFRKRFFEICAEPAVSMVGVKAAKYAMSLNQSWRCSACGSTNFSFDEGHHRCVSRASFGEVLPEMFMFSELGFAASIPVFSSTRWKALLASAKDMRIKGIASTRVEIIAESMADARPELPDYRD